MQDNSEQKDSAEVNKPLSRKVIVTGGVVTVAVIMFLMVAGLIFVGLQTKARINSLNTDRANALDKVEKDWGVSWEKAKTPNRVNRKDLYKNQLIAAEQVAISADYQAQISRTGDRFSVAAAIILAFGAGVIGIVVLVDVFLMLGAATPSAAEEQVEPPEGEPAPEEAGQEKEEARTEPE